MSATRVLYIGGTGTISGSSVHRSIELGHDVTVLNRGSSRGARGRSPHGGSSHGSSSHGSDVRELVADVRDASAVREAIATQQFDVVAEFLAFTPPHIEADLAQFDGRVGQYVFISSASAYQKPPRSLPVTEDTPLDNPFWQYSRDKIACEERLLQATDDTGFPVTIVRPSHTYDERSLPTFAGWTDVLRMRAGKPVVIHGDGTSLWTLTHSDDFAVAFTGLLGNPAAIGEAFTITGTHAPTWNQIYQWLADAAGVADPEFVHVSSDAIAAFDPERGASLLGDKAHSVTFDVSKITAIVPEFRTTITFEEGARRIVNYFDAHPEAQQMNAHRDELCDRLVAYARAAGRDERNQLTADA